MPRCHRESERRLFEIAPTEGRRQRLQRVIDLRRSREVTQVCSRKMTHQNDHLAQGKCAAWMPRRARRPARGWDKDLARLRRG